MRETLENIGIAVLIALGLRSCFYEPFKIPSSSMMPTLRTGDHIFVNKFTYGIQIPFTSTVVGQSLGEIERGDVVVEVILGDARDTLPAWSGRADAWYLDGFAPARNPALWAPELLAEVARHTAPGGTAATYTAAGAVRRGLAEAGFAVERVAGYGRKRHMTVARLG